MLNTIIDSQTLLGIRQNVCRCSSTLHLNKMAVLVWYISALFCVISVFEWLNWILNKKSEHIKFGSWNRLTVAGGFFRQHKKNLIIIFKMLNSQKWGGDLDQTGLEFETRSVPKHHSDCNSHFATFKFAHYFPLKFLLTSDRRSTSTSVTCTVISAGLVCLERRMSDWNMLRESCPLRLFLHTNQCSRCRHTSSASPVLARMKLHQPDLLSQSVSSYRFCLVHRLKYEKSIRFLCSCSTETDRVTTCGWTVLNYCLYATWFDFF